MSRVGALALLSAACADPAEGRYRLEQVVGTLDPLPVYTVNNALGAASPSTTSTAEPSGTVSDFFSAREAEYTHSGLAAELWISGDEATFEIGSVALTGGREGDGWVVQFHQYTEYTQWVTSPGGYRYEDVFAEDVLYEYHLTWVDDGLIGDGRETTALVSGFREVDEWSAAQSDEGPTELGVYGPRGEVLKNKPAEDDCEGDMCEILEYDPYDSYRVTFTAVKL